MRISLFADPHANREALAACLEHAAERGAERQVFLGDLVGYGADPAWVLDTVMDCHARGATAVLGNHDEAVLAAGDRSLHDDARQVAEWTRTRLAPAQLAFLASLPLQRQEAERLYVHANAWEPGGWSYVATATDAGRCLAATACRLVFCGHIHTPALYHQAPGGRVEAFTPVAGVAIPLGALRRWVAVLGAVGQPRDGNPAAAYALLDTAATTLTYFRVAYDATAASRKIRAAGLPVWLGARLETGG